MPYTHLLFDVDGTLLDFHQAQEDTFYRTCARYRIPADASLLSEYDRINQSLWRQLEEKRITREDLLTRRFETLFSVRGIGADPAAFNRDYLAALADTAFPAEGARAVLDTLHGHFFLAVVTNGVAAAQRSRLANADLTRYFDVLCISEEIGCEKPDPHFFDRTLARCGHPDPAHTLIIGDSLTADIGGGQAAGLDTCWYNPSHLPPPSAFVPTYIIDRLPDLLPIVAAHQKEDLLCPLQ